MLKNVGYYGEIASLVRYIFVTGGVLSSVGKGILTSSIGKMLQTRGVKVTVIKIDPYVNVDAGTLSWVARDVDGNEIDRYELKQ